MDSYEIRCKMAEMHDEMLKRLETAMDKKRYVEVSWLCYSIMEQRITRMIEKHVELCPRLYRASKIPAGISTRITCIKRLINKKYDVYANVDHDLIVSILYWCKNRNALVHSLLSLETYMQYDEEFRKLAETGFPLAIKIYDEATKVREWSKEHEFGEFPLRSCRCKKFKCICQSGNA